MKKSILLTLLVLVTIGAKAYDFSVDGIYYKIIDKKDNIVAVTSGDIKYAGDITIPETVSNDGVKYKVQSIEMEVFSYCGQLKSVVIPNSVTEIGGGIFYGCTGLESVVIGNGVKEIPWATFSGCSSLRSVTLGTSVETIGEHAFASCTSLTAINLEDHIVTISSKAFEGCSSLSSVTIGKSVRIIKSNAFTHCSSLSSLIIHEGIETIEMEAFTYCGQLKNVVIPNSVTEIGSGIFYGCTGLESVVIGNGVKEVPWVAFSGCSNLQNVTIGSSVEAIVDLPFRDCNNIRKVTSLSMNPCTFDSSAFPKNVYNDATLYVPKGTKGTYQRTEAWKRFYQIEETGGGTSDDNIVFADAEVKRICVENWDTNGDGELSKTEAAAVTELGQVFRENNKIKTFDELEYFTGLNEIGEMTFYCCFNLESVKIPNGITSIDYMAFAVCSSIEKIELPDNLDIIGEDAFGWCKSLVSIEIPQNVTKIMGGAFWCCESLSSLSIPKSVISLGERRPYHSGGFLGTSNVTIIKVEKDNPVYDSRDDCNAIIETQSNKLIVGCRGTVIPNTVITIGKNAFHGCNGLTTVRIPNSVRTIESGAFFECDDLVFVNIPAYTKSISYDSFAYNYLLRSIIIDSANPVYDSRDDCNAIIETSTNKLVVGCGGTIIPNTIKIIGRCSFIYCHALVKIIIPNSIVSIEGGAFRQCYNLVSVYSEITNPFAINETVFDGISSEATLYVPVGTKAKYEATEGWKEFKTIIEGEPSAIQSPTVITSSDIYSITGRKVRSNATSLDGLPKGIYIVNGKKVIKN